MVVLISIVLYIFLALWCGRWIYNETLTDWRNKSAQYQANHFGPHAYSMWGLLWPIVLIIEGWRWFVSGTARREARVAKRDRDKAEKERERFDATCKPWNMILHDPNATADEKAFALEVLRGLALK